MTATHSSETVPGGPPAGTDAPDSPSRRHPRPAGGAAATALLFLLPAAAALAVTLRGIGTGHLTRDEHATWWAATLPLKDLGRLIRHTDVSGTPYFVLMHLWTALFGDSPTVLRVPSAAAMAAAAGLLALLGRRLFDARAGFLAGLSFAVLPSTVRYGQDARPYAMAVAAAVLSTLLLVRAVERPSFKAWVAYTLSLPLVGWSRTAALAVLAGHLGMVLLERRRGDRIVGWAFTAAVLTGASFVVPMVWQALREQSAVAVSDRAFAGIADYPHGLFGATAVGVAVLALGAVGFAASGRHAALLAPWALLPLAVAWPTESLLRHFSPHDLLFTAPAWLLAAAAAICRLTGPPAASGQRTGAGLTAAGWLLTAAATAGLAWQALPATARARSVLAGEPDFQGAARIVLREQHRGDAIAFSGDDATDRRAMAYALRDASERPKDVMVRRTPQQVGRYAAVEWWNPEECLAETQRLWLVSTSPRERPFAGMTAKAARVLRREFRVVAVSSLANVRVLLLERVRRSPAAPAGDSPAARKVHL